MATVKHDLDNKDLVTSSLASKRQRTHSPDSIMSTLSDTEALASPGEASQVDLTSDLLSDLSRSSTADVLSGSLSNSNYIEILPDSIQIQIFEYLVPSDKGSIHPFYPKGVSFAGPRRHNHYDRYVSAAEKISIPPLIFVNRRFRNNGLSALYGSNTFNFSDADTCTWWLKKIGDENISRIRNLSIEVNTGWTTSRDVRDYDNDPDQIPYSGIDNTYEELWLRVVNILQHKHNLYRFKVILCAWTDLTNADVRADLGLMREDAEELTKYRHLFVKKLRDLRGIHSPSIREKGGYYLSAGIISILRLAMQQRYVKPIPREKLTPSQFLARLQARGERREREQDG